MNENPDVTPERRAQRPILPWLLLAAVALALTWVWLFTSVQRQDKWMRTAIIGMAGYVAFLVWVLFRSRWPARVRWALFAGTLAVILFCRFGLRISGVSGDLFPIVEWRWKKERIVSEKQNTRAASSPVVARATIPLTN